VRAGRATGRNPNQNFGYSLDGGKTWQASPTLPAQPQPANPGPFQRGPQTSSLGHAAVSADGATWVWTPERNNTFFTKDRGATWNASTGLPNNTRVIADPVDPQKFYALALFDGKLFTSTDGGANFTPQPLDLPGGLPHTGGNRGDSRGGQDRLYATPGKSSDLWIAAFEGLYHSTDSGKTFIRQDGVQEIHAFGFGKAAPTASGPALYLIGIVGGVRGIFRSDDTAGTWVRINDDQHQWGLLLQITGDPKRYGRVYVGTHGRGTMYGDPSRP